MKTMSKTLVPLIFLLTIAQIPSSANAAGKVSSTSSIVAPNPLKIALGYASRAALKSTTWVAGNIENLADKTLYIGKINNFINNNPGKPRVIVEKIKRLFLGEIKAKYPGKAPQIDAFVRNVLDPALRAIKGLGF